MIDAHCHLHSEQFGNDIDRRLADARQTGVRGWVCCATRPGDWPAVAAVAAQHTGSIKPAYGVHPWHVSEAGPDWKTALKAMLLSDPGAAVGETGLDGLRDDRALQRRFFEEQLDLAIELDRTLCIHCVRDWGALLGILRSRLAPPPFVVHSYGGSPDTARELGRMGGYVSVSGLICRARARRMRETAGALSDDRLLVETDAPYLCPDAGEGGVCVPADLKRVVVELAELRNTPVDTVADITDANACRAFRWRPS